MDDLISRQAAINLIESIETERLKGNVELIYAPAIKGLRALPPVTPTEKVGEWIYIGNKDINQSVKIVECNVCHKRNMGSSDYCPSCGRKMQEVKNNEIDN